MKTEEEKKYFGPKAKNREKMINRVHKGVPDSVRGRLWYILLEVDKLKREQRGVYEKMRELARRVSPDIRQIDLVNSHRQYSPLSPSCPHENTPNSVSL